MDYTGQWAELTMNGLYRIVGGVNHDWIIQDSGRS